MFTSRFILHIPFRERIFGTLPRVSPGLTKILFFVFVFVAEVSVSVAAFGRVLRRVSLSVAAGFVERDGFWAGAAHPRRQKHREMPPPGTSAPAFAATVEPASSPSPCKHPRQDASATRDGTRAGRYAEGGLLSAANLRVRF